MLLQPVEPGLADKLPVAGDGLNSVFTENLDEAANQGNALSAVGVPLVPQICPEQRERYIAHAYGKHQKIDLIATALPVRAVNRQHPLFIQQRSEDRDNQQGNAAVIQIEVVEKVLEPSGLGGELRFAGDIRRKVVELDRTCGNGGADDACQTVAATEVSLGKIMQLRANSVGPIPEHGSPPFGVEDKHCHAPFLCKLNHVYQSVTQVSVEIIRVLWSYHSPRSRATFWAAALCFYIIDVYSIFLRCLAPRA